jgi:hypothetical protein
MCSATGNADRFGDSAKLVRMNEPDQNDLSPSEKANSDAASPAVGRRPDFPESQIPPGTRVFDAPLIPMPLPKSIRPPASGLPHLMPKPSSVPPPRLRPVSPPESSNNIGPGSLSQPAPQSDTEISATQEIAEALSSAPWTEGGQAGASANAARSNTGAPMVRAHGSNADPLAFRRTIIPILLTGGVILAGAGALLMFGGEDNALSDLFPGWVPIMFCVLASVCLGFGILNMLAVKNAKG